VRGQASAAAACRCARAALPPALEQRRACARRGGAAHARGGPPHPPPQLPESKQARAGPPPVCARSVKAEEVEVAPGVKRVQASVVHIEKCRYLESSGCVGMCVNMCKVNMHHFRLCGR
jgi:hypothetical protein